jgi:uncharacterized repeat protein (TIGR01451 family)
VPGSPASSATFSWQAGTLAVTSSNGSTTLVPVATACPDLAAGATSGPLVCNLGTMAPNEVVTIKFKMTAQSLPAGRLTGTVFHNATVSAKEEGLTDPALDVLADNDTNDRTSTRDPSVPPGSIEDVDLSLDKDGTSSALVGPSDRLKAGDTVVYTLTVKNEETEVGRNSTLGVVTDVLPTGVTLVSAPGCTHDTATRTLTCPVGTLAPQATRDFTVSVTLDTPYSGARPLVNRATVNAPGDPNPSNDPDEKELPVEGPPPAQAIPTLSEWALIALSMLLAAFALRRMPLQPGRRM